MRLGATLLPGRFLRRLNRFAALVEVDGRATLVHVANSGRLQELLQPGNRVILSAASGANRKTAHDLTLVDLGHILVSADARLPARILQEAIQDGRLAPFSGYRHVTREVSFGSSRLDLLLEGLSGRCLIETKSVTLVVDGVGLFPDAPTIRGTRHLRELEDAAQHGYRAAVAFIAQRADAQAFSPNDSADAAFGKTLRHVAQHGVEVYAYRCQVSPEEIRLEREIPVIL